MFTTDNSPVDSDRDQNVWQIARFAEIESMIGKAEARAVLRTSRNAAQIHARQAR